MLIDSHAHLEMFETDQERQQIVDRAQRTGVTTILSVGTTLAGSRLNIEIARQYASVLAAVGVHPHDVDTVEMDVMVSELNALAADNNVVAIGEIGLDFYRNLSSPERQRECFRQQLQLALELQLPVIIHDREAHQEVIQIIEEVDISPVGGIIHCFSGDLVMAERVRELGCFISIAGPVTFKNAGHLPEIVRKMPLDALLIETDSPFLSPVPFRGKRNEPAYVRYVAEKIAELKGLSVTEVAEQTSRNFATLFNTWGKSTKKTEENQNTDTD